MRMKIFFGSAALKPELVGFYDGNGGFAAVLFNEPA
jgi:hypothetical protein